MVVLGAGLALMSAAPAVAREDPLLDEQYALSDPGLVGAEQAWSRATGKGVLVAVLDTGMETTHPDLRANVWTNPGEVAGNGVDDDANGIVDDVHGANLITGTADVRDDSGHGTHTAGMIAASSDNGTGGAGVAPQAKLLPVKVLDSHASGTGPVLAAGIRYALREGARILNVPLNSDTPSPEIETAIAEAAAAGATIVASAGNDGRDIDATPSYPASLPDENVLAVTALGTNGAIWSPANRGARSVDLAAPGEDVLSTARGGAYEERSGTSMAASYVSGALAGLSSARPDLGQPALRRALRDSARRLPALQGATGTGELNLVGALRRVLPGASMPSSVQLRTPQVSAGQTTLTWSTKAVRGAARWRVALDGRPVRAVRSGRTLRVRARISAGRHRWRVVALDSADRRLSGRGGRVMVSR